MIDHIMEQIRKQADECTGLQGFMIYKSISGGTGSGLSALIQERLSVDFGRKCNCEFIVFPSEQDSDNPFESYNALHSIHSSLDHVDFSLCFDNLSVN